MTNVIPFAERKAAGDAHEFRVRQELELRGWTVDSYGQGILSGEVKRALGRTESLTRWDPEFIAACGSVIRYVDAKGSLRGAHTDQNFISRKAVAAHLKLAAERDIPVFYVFDDLGVLTPAEVMRHAGVERLGNAAGYLAVPRKHSRSFDVVFGSPHTPTWGAAPLLFDKVA